MKLAQSPADPAAAFTASESVEEHQTESADAFLEALRADVKHAEAHH
jgi:hypothetical protein